MSKLNGYAKGGGGVNFLVSGMQMYTFSQEGGGQQMSAINLLQELVTWMFGPRHLFRLTSRSRGKQG
jgi:hypothetical protein